jgi:hypothetical protein
MKKIGKLLAFMLVSGIFSFANASGTAAGTDIVNSATLSFGDTEDSTSTVEAQPDTFKVDKKIDIVVTTLDLAPVQTKNGTTSVVLKFKVQNNGNSVQDFILSALKTSTTAFDGSVTNNFSADNVRVYVDNGDGVYNANDDQLTYLDEIDIDAQSIVFVVSDMPTDRVNGDVAVYDLQAQVAEGGVSGQQGSAIESDDRNSADNALTVQIVFADGERDGKFSSVDAYKIVIGNMTIQKVSVVLEDPVNGTTNPKRIPGATIRYCFSVENSGDANVAIAKIGDDLDESRYDVSNLSNNDIRIYNGTDTFDCATAVDTNTQANPNTGSVNTGTGEIVIDLQGVDAGKSKSAYIDLILQ